MPTLHWIGKDKVVNHHQDVPFRVLERQYSFDEKGQHTQDKHSENMIIKGDNLEALKALLPMYEGKVKCIYIDPPYNTGNEGWIYNDNVNDPRINKWLGDVVGREGEDLTRHDKWLCMMYPRIRILQKLLSIDGAFFVSIDDNEQAHLKLICDEIFGISCFVTDLIWRSADSSNNDSKQFSTDYNHTLIYSKTSRWQPMRFARREENNAHYANPDGDSRGAWFSGNVSSPNPRENLRYDVIAPNGNFIKAPKNGWRWSKERMYEMISEKMVVFSEDNTRIVKKTFLKDQSGIVPSNIWWDVEDTGHNRNAKYELMKIFYESHSSEVFKTPKPTRFIEKVLQLFSAENLIVIDSFAGSGTTAHAVLNMNKQDGGNRKFILIEMMDYADNITAERVKRVIRGYGGGNKAVEGTGGSFNYFELGEALLNEDETLNEKVNIEKIKAYVWHTETRTPYRVPESSAHPHWLGRNAGTDYYFNYKKGQTTTLSLDYLSSIRETAEHYVIYADINALSEEELLLHNITFKKIPRDITRI